MINIWSRDNVNSVPWLDCFAFVQNCDDKSSEKLYFAQLWKREGRKSRPGGFFLTVILKKKTMMSALWVLRIIEIYPHAIGNYRVTKKTQYNLCMKRFQIRKKKNHKMSCFKACCYWGSKPTPLLRRRPLFQKHSKWTLSSEIVSQSM